MSFEHLPENWSDLPLDTPGLAADVADLVVGIGDRESGCTGLLVTDGERRLLQPMVVGEVPDEGGHESVAGRLDSVLSLVRGLGGALGVVRGRPGPVLLTDADRRWHEAVLAACRRHEVPLLGAWLATPEAVRPFPAALSEADVIAS
jgi:hypothetical protein